MEEILTPAEVSDLLKIHLKTVYKLAEKGQLSGATRIGRSWRFKKTDLMASFDQKPIAQDHSVGDPEAF